MKDSKKNTRTNLSIEPMQGWISPLLKIRFEMREDELHIFFPDGSEFLTIMELDELLKLESQGAEKQLLRAEKLAAQLRQLGIESDNNI